MRYCTNCGQPLGNERFCTKCGTKCPETTQNKDRKFINYKHACIIATVIVFVIVVSAVAKHATTYTVIGSDTQRLEYNGVVVYDEDVDYSDKNYISGDYIKLKGKLKYEKTDAEYHGEPIGGFVIKLKKPIIFNGKEYNEVQLAGNSYSAYEGKKVSIFGTISTAPSGHYIREIFFMPYESDI